MADATGHDADELEQTLAADELRAGRRVGIDIGAQPRIALDIGGTAEADAAGPPRTARRSRAAPAAPAPAPAARSGDRARVAARLPDERAAAARGRRTPSPSAPPLRARGSLSLYSAISAAVYAPATCGSPAPSQRSATARATSGSLQPACQRQQIEARLEPRRLEQIGQRRRQPAAPSRSASSADRPSPRRRR